MPVGLCSAVPLYYNRPTVGGVRDSQSEQAVAQLLALQSAVASENCTANRRRPTRLALAWRLAVYFNYYRGRVDITDQLILRLLRSPGVRSAVSSNGTKSAVQHHLSQYFILC